MNNQITSEFRRDIESRILQSSFDKKQDFSKCVLKNVDFSDYSKVLIDTCAIYEIYDFLNKSFDKKNKFSKLVSSTVYLKSLDTLHENVSTIESLVNSGNAQTIQSIADEFLNLERICKNVDAFTRNVKKYSLSVSDKIQDVYDIQTRIQDYLSENLINIETCEFKDIRSQFINENCLGYRPINPSNRDKLISSRDLDLYVQGIISSNLELERKSVILTHDFDFSIQGKLNDEMSSPDLILPYKKTKFGISKLYLGYELR